MHNQRHTFVDSWSSATLSRFIYSRSAVGNPKSSSWPASSWSNSAIPVFACTNGDDDDDDEQYFEMDEWTKKKLLNLAPAKQKDLAMEVQELEKNLDQRKQEKAKVDEEIKTAEEEVYTAEEEVKTAKEEVKTAKEEVKTAEEEARTELEAYEKVLARPGFTIFGIGASGKILRAEKIYDLARQKEEKARQKVEEARQKVEEAKQKVKEAKQQVKEAMSTATNELKAAENKFRNAQFKTIAAIVQEDVFIKEEKHALQAYTRGEFSAKFKDFRKVARLNDDNTIEIVKLTKGRKKDKDPDILDLLKDGSIYIFSNKDITLQ